MTYSVGSSLSYPLSQDVERLFVNHSHSSPIFQHNYTIRFENMLFLIDQKIEPIVRKVFKGTLEDLSKSVIGFPIPLWSSKYLTPQIADHIFLFFRRGVVKLQEGSLQSGDLLLSLTKASERYGLSLLNSYLGDLVWSSTDNPFHGGLFLDSLEQLELAALHQQPALFCKLLDQYLEIKDERSFETVWNESVISNATSSLKAPSIEEFSQEASGREAGVLNEISRVMISFEIKSFEKVACVLRMRDHSLYEQVIKTYTNAHQYCLDDLIHQVIDVQIKWDMIACIPLLERRMLWFVQLDIEASNETIERALIIPLTVQTCFDEAFKWAAKIEDEQAMQAVKERMDEVAINPSSQEDWAMIRFIQDEVQELITKTNETVGVFARRFLIANFHENVETYLSEINQQGWTQPLLVCAIRYYIQNAAEMLVAEHVKDIQDKCAVSEYGKYLHPAMMEDLQLIKAHVRTVKDHLVRVFGSDRILLILENQHGCLSENCVAELLIIHIRYLFQKQFSLRTDFIIQEISNYLQPYFFKSEAPEETKPFMERLEKKLSQVKLGGELNAQEIMLVKEFYIRKGVEVANYRYCEEGGHKLDPYEASHVAPLRELKEVLQVAFKADFRENDLARLSAEQKESFEGPMIMREVFVQAINAKFKALNI